MFSFGAVDLNNTNGAHQGDGSESGQQLNKPSRSFGQPSSSSNQASFSTSASFPPFGGDTNSSFSSQFAPPNSGFNFTAAAGPVANNPFSSINANTSGRSAVGEASQLGGFKGSIFNIPPAAPFDTSFSNANGTSTAPSAVDQPLFKWGSSEGASQPDTKSRTDTYSSNAGDVLPNVSPSNIFRQSYPQQSSNNSSTPNSVSVDMTKSAQPTPNFPAQNLLPQDKSQSLFDHTKTHHTQSTSNIFEQSSTLFNQSQQSSLLTTQDDDSMATSPDNSPQPKGAAAARPFEFLSNDREPVSKVSANEQVQGGSIFSRISEPTISDAASTPTENQPPEHDFQSQNKNNYTMKFPSSLSGFSTIPTTTGNQTEQTSPTRSSKSKVAPSPVMSLSENVGPASSIFSEDLRIPQAPVSSQNTGQPTPLISALPDESKPSAIQTKYIGSLPFASVTASPDQNMQTSALAHQAWGKPPPAPPDFTDVQRHQLVTGYYLKCLDAGLQRHISKNQSFHNESEIVTKFYMNAKHAILNRERVSCDGFPSHKRKSMHTGYDDGDDAQTKKLKFDSPPPGSVREQEQAASGGLRSTSSTSQPLLTEPASLPLALPTKGNEGGNSAMSQGIESVASAGRPHREDVVMYPPLSSSPSSQTSNIFKSILQNKDQSQSPSIFSNIFSEAQPNTTSMQSPGTSQSLPKSLSTDRKIDEPRLLSSNTDSNNVQQNFTSTHSDQSVTSTTSESSFKSIIPGSQPQSLASASRKYSTGENGQDNKNLSTTAPNPFFTPPKFGAPSNFLSQFGKAAEENARNEKASRKAKEFDSDEDDEAEWERKDAEEQRAKKQKLDESLKGKVAAFIPGNGFVISSGDAEKTEPENNIVREAPNVFAASTSTGLGTSVLAKPSQGVFNGQNIFGHLSDIGSRPESSQVGDADDENTGSEGEHDDVKEGRIVKTDDRDSKANNSTDEQSKSSANANSFKPSFSFSTKPILGTNTSSTGHSASSGRSLFDRITKDDDGNILRDVTASSDPKDEGLFKPAASQLSNSVFGQGSLGAGNSTFGRLSPSVVDKSVPYHGTTPQTSSSLQTFGVTAQSASTTSVAPPFGSNKSPGADNTWKFDSPIKFGNSPKSAPGVTVTSPTPAKSSLGGLFGSPPANALAEESSKPPANIFSFTPAKAPPVSGFGFNFGGPPKVAMGSLAPPANVTSNTTSRATSPGATTGGESANESNADGADEESEKHEQLDLTARGPGEEDEDVLFAVRAKAMAYDGANKSWANQGMGILRVLKHRETNKTRILMRQDPSGKIVINAALLSSMTYQYVQSKCVKMGIATDAGKLSTWSIRVAEDKNAVELAKILEANKLV